MVAKKAIAYKFVWIILMIIIAIVAAIVIATIVVPGIYEGGDILSIFSTTAKEQSSGAFMLLPIKSIIKKLY